MNRQQEKRLERCVKKAAAQGVIPKPHSCLTYSQDMVTLFPSEFRYCEGYVVYPMQPGSSTLYCTWHSWLSMDGELVDLVLDVTFDGYPLKRAYYGLAGC